MSETTYITVDVTNGEAVADVIGSLYVNSYSNPSKRFFECMAEAKPEIQYGFTMLCFEWFVSLAKADYYDDRNKAAVEYARNISGIFENVAFEENVNAKKCSSVDFIFNYCDDEAAVQLIDGYLTFSKDNTDFISLMLNKHRTLQQSFSRMCCKWFEYVSQSESEEDYVLLAKKAAEQFKGFPLI